MHMDLQLQTLARRVCQTWAEGMCPLPTSVWQSQMLQRVVRHGILKSLIFWEFVVVSGCSSMSLAVRVCAELIELRRPANPFFCI
jgi:hypothetical protein